MKPISWKTIAASTLAIGVLGAIVPAQSQTRVDFTVAEYSSNTGPYFEQVAAAFEKENPDIDIKIQVVPWDTLLQRLTSDIAGGTTPDISIIGTRWLLDFASQGVAESLDAHLTPEFKSTFIDTFMAPSVVDGKIMGLPVAASARAMMINTDLFEKAGATPPTNWDEFYDAAKKLSALPDTFGFGLQGKEIETDAYYYYSLWTHGGDILKADGTSGLDSPEALKAAVLYKTMIDERLTQPSPTNYNREEVFNLFKQGKVGMVFTFPMLIPQIKAEAPNLHYKIMPFPEGKAKATYGVTDTLMMFANSDVKDAAWKFIEFAYKDEWRTKFDHGEGFLPVTKNVAAEEFYKTDPDISGFAAGLPYAKFAPTIANWEEIADITVRTMQQIYLGQQAPEAALQAAAAQINTIRSK
ncbi:sugar ABC transporter substrate-binding protein [Mesorhizobium sp. M00.F.Ca.ET.216.01.1.1]|uniref:ABC transporter substrate-binding protein n=1 Tax=Mesorhizobium sp. M00.F.Ca.ET.216.01.1.1 TaxID=2500528 RepID=UPI000FDC0117|nr:sugar ABC transporter substrate-binding protein [Mesorhizobium sp. M00.F.Ca.ET.216.01.1.1]TGQ39436.1 sugar ABC transporter substrate-binding protein [Mesorhizobium sp. M00.F.Ca.ET.216.01.1.1]TIS57512.1 MAG: extracellular solute-binding protein [Mesorhizobium sp.]TJW11704.1 MAG: extracellular solute-binding protein [Mesorhizobium sp.]TJW42220.1 MAG: extracellular solute-binding protein [Mesorhizobium sp.]